MKNVIGLIAVAGLAAAASADDVARLRYETSVNGGTWTAGANTALPGQRVEVRAVVSYIGAGTTSGLCQIVFQPTAAGWTAGDVLRTNAVVGLAGAGYQPTGIGPFGSGITTPQGQVADAPGVYGRISPWGTANATTSATFLRGHSHTVNGVSYLRIAQNQVTNWFGAGSTANNVNGGGGVSIAQGALGGRPTTFPAPVFTDQDLVVFKFGFDLSADPADRSITIDTPANGIGSSGTPLSQNVLFFANAFETTGSIRGSAVVESATVRIVPAPASLALMGLGGLMVARRRR